MKTVGEPLISLVGLLTFVVGFYPGLARPQNKPFYENKTVRVIVRSTPGGGYDLMSRVVARHLGKHLPGNPSVIVVNMPGAGGLVAASHMYHRAKPDGLTIALLDRTAPLHQLIHPDLAEKADFKKFRYLGSVVKDSSVLVIRKQTGMQNFDDLMRSKKKVVPGGTTKSAAGYQIPYAMELAWGLPFERWVLGYPGASQQVMAMQRGENDLIGSTVDSLAAMPQLVELGEPLVTATRERDPRLPKVPTVFEMAEKYPPNSKYWPLVEALVDASEWGRPFVAPPGIPEDRLGVLRDAFEKVFRDEAFKQDAQRLNLFVNPVSGKKQEELIQKAMNPPEETIILLKMLAE